MNSLSDIFLPFSLAVVIIFQSLISSGYSAPLDITKLISMHSDSAPSHEEGLIHSLIQKAAGIDSVESDRDFLQRLLSDISSDRLTNNGNNVKRSTMAVENSGQPAVDMGFGRSLSGSTIGSANAAMLESHNPVGPG